MTRIINQLPPQLRAVIGVLLGVTVGFAVMMLIRSMLPYQPPTGVDVQQAKAYNNWVGSLPTQGYIYYLVTFLTSAMVAGAVSGYFVLDTRYKIAVPLTGFMLLVLAIGNFLAFNHPEWLTYASCIGFVAFAWLGGAIVRGVSRLAIAA